MLETQQPIITKAENLNSQKAEQAEKASLEIKIAALKKQDTEARLAIALLEVGINSIAHSTNAGLNTVKMWKFKLAAIKIRIKNLQLRLSQISNN